MKKILLIIAIFCCLTGCSGRNVDFVKSHATEVWEQNGFKVVGYEGYQRSFIFDGVEGGYVWYIVERDGVTYHGAIGKWENEFHIYSLTAMNAISSKGNE